MVRDRYDVELNIGDEVIFIVKRFGVYLQKGTVIRFNPKSVVVGYSELRFVVYRPEINIYKL